MFSFRWLPGCHPPLSEREISTKDRCSRESKAIDYREPRTAGVSSFKWIHDWQSLFHRITYKLHQYVCN